MGIIVFPKPARLKVVVVSNFRFIDFLLASTYNFPILNGGGGSRREFVFPSYKPTKQVSVYVLWKIYICKIKGLSQMFFHDAMILSRELFFVYFLDNFFFWIPLF